MRRVLQTLVLILLGSSPGWAQRATQEMKIGCEQLLNRQISEERGGAQVQTNLRTSRDQQISNTAVRLTGEADVTVDGRRETVGYECTFNTSNNYAESASYRRNQGWGGGGGSGSGRSGG